MEKWNLVDALNGGAHGKVEEPTFGSVELHAPDLLHAPALWSVKHWTKGVTARRSATLKPDASMLPSQLLPE